MHAKPQRLDCHHKRVLQKTAGVHPTRHGLHVLTHLSNCRGLFPAQEANQQVGDTVGIGRRWTYLLHALPREVYRTAVQVCGGYSPTSYEGIATLEDTSFKTTAEFNCRDDDACV